MIKMLSFTRDVQLDKIKTNEIEQATSQLQSTNLVTFQLFDLELGFHVNLVAVKECIESARCDIYALFNTCHQQENWSFYSRNSQIVLNIYTTATITNIEGRVLEWKN